MGVEEQAARFWGFWTRGKLDLLRRYLNAFTTATKNKSSECLYLDLFGGRPENRERQTNDVLDGSANIALATTDPPFTRLRFFELEPHAGRLRQRFASDYPSRDLEVIPGDCNETIGEALRSLLPVRWAPTFAFVDPNGPDVHWTTLKALAEFKKPGGPKVEIWMLLAAGMFIRNLPRDGSPTDQAVEKLTAMYGDDHWRTVYASRVDGALTAREAREEYVNLMRWRLENVLGYRWTHPLEIYNERGHSIYHMVFATDHPAGHEIMTSLYNRSATEFPAMRRAARLRQRQLADAATGVVALFDFEPDDPGSWPIRRSEKLYQHTEPWRPYGLR